MNDELRPENDMKSLLKDGVRGKHARKHSKMTAIQVPTVDERKKWIMMVSPFSMSKV